MRNSGNGKRERNLRFRTIFWRRGGRGHDRGNQNRGDLRDRETFCAFLV